jgi:hypothetical protein
MRVRCALTARVDRAALRSPRCASQERMRFIVIEIGDRAVAEVDCSSSDSHRMHKRKC